MIEPNRAKFCFCRLQPIDESPDERLATLTKEISGKSRFFTEICATFCTQERHGGPYWNVRLCRLRVAWLPLFLGKILFPNDRTPRFSPPCLFYVAWPLRGKRLVPISPFF
jgi:hypothetical protein